MATEWISFVKEKAFEKRRDFHLHELQRLDVKLQQHQKPVPNPMVMIVFNNSSHKDSCSLPERGGLVPTVRSHYESSCTHRQQSAATPPTRLKARCHGPLRGAQSPPLNFLALKPTPPTVFPSVLTDGDLSGQNSWGPLPWDGQSLGALAEQMSRELGPPFHANQETASEPTTDVFLKLGSTGIVPRMQGVFSMKRDLRVTEMSGTL